MLSRSVLAFSKRTSALTFNSIGLHTTADVVIAGGGMVGTAMAAAVAKIGKNNIKYFFEK